MICRTVVGCVTHDRAEALLTGKPAKDAQRQYHRGVRRMSPNEAAVVLRVQEYSAVIATIN